MAAMFSQSFFIPNPTMTEHQLQDQSDRVHMITGGYSGIGYELAKILYARNATVFIAGRDVTKAKRAIHDIKATRPKSRGSLEYLFLDLSDLASIKGSVEDFSLRANQLHVLVNNAGVMVPPIGSRTVQGHELQMGVNCLGPYLLTQLLMPTLCRTVLNSPVGSVRVLWTGSVAVETAPPGGIQFDVLSKPLEAADQKSNYSLSKVGNILLAVETARRYGEETGIISVALNPGNLDTALQRNMVWWQYAVAKTLLYPAVLGAYTQLFAGWSSSLSLESNGAYIWPWGRVGHVREDICQAMKPVQEGGSATPEKFWSWCEDTVSDYR